MNGSATTRSDWSHRAAAALLCMAVACIALWLRSGAMHDVIEWDEADYALAAEKGLAVNALELGPTNQHLRHAHAPLMVYAIRASTACFGLSTWSIRLPGILVGSFACVVLILATRDLSIGSQRTRTAAGTIAGLLLATSPVAVEIDALAHPHTYVVLFLILNVWLLGRYVRRPTRQGAYLFGASLAGQFVSMEYGPVVVVLSLAALAVTRPTLIGLRLTRLITKDGRSIRRPRIHRDAWRTFTMALVLTALVWPAGIFLGGIAINFGYYVLYAAHGHAVFFRGELMQHVPKYAYAWWYGQQYPLLLVAIMVGLSLTAVRAMVSSDRAARVAAVFAFGVAAVVHSSHIMMLSKSVFMMPVLILAGVTAATWVVHKLTTQTWAIPAWGRMMAAPTMLVVAVVGIVGGQTRAFTLGAGPNRHLPELCRTLSEQAEPGDRVLAHAWPIVRFILHEELGREDLIIVSYDARNAVAEDLALRMRRGEFQWAVTVASQAAAYPACPALTVLHEQWRIAQEATPPPAEYRLYLHPNHHVALVHPSAAREPLP